MQSCEKATCERRRNAADTPSGALRPAQSPLCRAPLLVYGSAWVGPALSREESDRGSGKDEGQGVGIDE